MNYVGDTFTTPRGTLTIHEIIEDNTMKNNIILTCSHCSQDSELWPYGSIRTNYLKLFKSTIRFPCGCKKSIKYTEEQNKIRVRRKCEVNGYIFLGWTNTYTRIHKTGVKVFDLVTGEYESFHSIANFFTCKGNSRSRMNIALGLREEVNTLEDVRVAMSKQNYHKGTTIEGKKEGTNYWNLRCGKCSSDEYIQEGLCSGIFPIIKGDIDKGIIPCRCSAGFRWNQSQREYQLNKKLNYIGGVFLGWCEGGYVNRSSKFMWECVRGHTTSKDVLSFMQGRGCPICAKEGSNYGYFPTRGTEIDQLYLIKFTGGDEVFYKIGRSFNTTNRMRTFLKSYDVELIGTFDDTHDRVYLLEQCLHRLCKAQHVTPLVYFKGGKNECFSPEILYHPEVNRIFNL